MKITHTINNSQYKLNKYSGVPWKQHSLSILNIIFRETPNSVVTLKVQRTQDDSWFYCKQVQEMPPRTLPKTVVHKDQVNKGEALSRHRYKETRILLINTIAFSQVEVN